MDVPEKVCEVLHWNHLGCIGIYERSCNIVDIDGLDNHLPKDDVFSIEEWKFGRSRRIQDTIL